MGDLIRWLLIVFCLITVLLTACGFGGILVEPTAPAGETADSETKQTLPSETEVFPTKETAAQTETVPVTVMPTETTVPVTSSPTTAPPETTHPATAPPTTAPPETTHPATAPPTTAPPETTHPATAPPTTAPTETTAPAAPTVPPATESTSPTEPTANPNSGRHDPEQPELYSVSSAERALLDQIHVLRKGKNLSNLTEDSYLGGLAYLRATELAQQFSHIRPDGRGYAAVLTDYGYDVSASGETILKCEDWYPAAYIVEDWTASKVTSNVLTDPSYTHIGVGIAEKDGHLYVVCLLAAK